MDPATAAALVVAVNAANVRGVISILTTARVDPAAIFDFLSRPVPIDIRVAAAFIKYIIHVVNTPGVSNTISAALIASPPHGPIVHALLARGFILPAGTAAPACVIPTGTWATYSKQFDLPVVVPAADSRGDRDFRKMVLLDTLTTLSTRVGIETNAAMANLARWQAAAAAAPVRPPLLEVIEGDWGTITKRVTDLYGEIYTVLNMAHATHPGGGYQNGESAQEENMFYRSSCHFYIDRGLDVATDLINYTQPMTDLINAVNDIVYLDTMCPRVCSKGQEHEESFQNFRGVTQYKIARPTSYVALDANNKFPFYEMRAAADDLRGGRPFNMASMTKKIEAQFTTLIRHGVRRVVLSAFGCGAFENPPAEVAAIYRTMLVRYQAHFDHIVFAIISLKGVDTNFTTFYDALVPGGVPVIPRGGGGPGGPLLPPGPRLPVPPGGGGGGGGPLVPPGGGGGGPLVPPGGGGGPPGPGGGGGGGGPPGVHWNFFIKKTVPAIFDGFTYAGTIPITSIEKPYFALQCITTALPARDRLRTLPIDVTATSFPPIAMQHEVLVDPNDPAVLDELAFLEHQCLAFKRGTTYYVSDQARLFYGNTGLFANPAPKTPTAMRPLATLFVNYILPGQFWRRYYALYPLPAKIAAMQKLNTELTEIESESNNLRISLGL